MPKIIAHALTGAGIVALIHPTAGIKKWFPLIIGAILAISPDFDYLIEWIWNITDIHRGLTHSLIFSTIIGLIIYVLLRKKEEGTVIAYCLAFLSHTVLDSLTSTAGGVKFFYPFSKQYYYFGWTNLFELPVGNTFAEVRNWVLIETVCFLPFFLILIIIKYLKNKNL